MSQSAWWSLLLVGGLLLFVTNTWLLTRALYPLYRLTERTKHLASGDLAALQSPLHGIQEIGVLRHTMASMAQHVQRTHKDEVVFRHAITDGQEAERQRIARELHDETVQSLIAIAQSIDLANQWLERDPQRAGQLLKASRTQAVESVGDLRRLIANLRPPALEELGLTPALRMMTQAESGLSVTVEVCGAERRLNESLELTLFRVAQEAIQNARRHGQAKQVALKVDFRPNELMLTVRDDGGGFCPPEQLEFFASTGHYGLLGMRERLEQLNGSLIVSSEPEQGTEIRAMIPLERTDQPTTTVRDPVCGALIQPEQAYGSTRYHNHRYYFCCPVCQGAFQQDPETYVSSTSEQ